MYDTDKDGFVNFQEFIVALDIVKNGTPEQNLKQIFRMLDVNDDGKVNVTELVQVSKDVLDLVKQKEPGNYVEYEEMAGAAFAEMDADVNGHITEDEFINACLAQKKCTTCLILHIIDLLSN